MSTAYKFSFGGVLFPCIASVIQSFTPLWVFLVLICTGMAMTGIGLLVVSRQAKHQELVQKMDKAFGVPRDRQK
jgi:hypothetical protein